MRSELLKLQRFIQKPSECAVAAAASVANYYNKKIDYKVARKIAEPDGDGMYTPDISILLNRLGFTKVTIVSADISILDFKWQNISKEKLVEKLKRMSRYHSDYESRAISRSYVKLLTDEENQNQLIIDLHFGDYIRKAINAKKPVLANFNFNLFFNCPKWDNDEKVDPIKGDYTQHEVVITGYNEKGVIICDSHHQLYRGRLAKYRTGRYKMDWETLHTVMGFGDLIIPEKYSLARAREYELI